MNKENIKYEKDYVLNAFIDDFYGNKLKEEEKLILKRILFSADYLVPCKITGDFQEGQDEFDCIATLKEDIIYLTDGQRQFVPIFTSKENIPNDFFENYYFDVLSFEEILMLCSKPSQLIINPLTNPIKIFKSRNYYHSI